MSLFYSNFFKEHEVNDDVSYINASKGREVSLKCNRKARNNFPPCIHLSHQSEMRLERKLFLNKSNETRENVRKLIAMKLSESGTPLNVQRERALLTARISI